MDSVHVSTINIHGLRNRLKRKSFFDSLKKKKYDIICVQESYITDKDADQWEREWGGRLFYSSVSSHSMGQLILVNKQFSCDIQCLKKSDRILTVLLKLDSGDFAVSLMANFPR